MSVIYAKDILSYGMIIANIIFFGINAYFSWRSCQQNVKKNWICLATAFLCAYWALLYVYVLLSDLQLFPPRIGDWSVTWVRPALTLTAALWAISNMVRFRKM